MRSSITLPRCWALLATLTVAGGCGGPGPTAPEPMLMPDWGQASVLGGGGVLTYAFTLDPEALDQLLSTATQEIYVPAELTVSGEPAGTVGLRFKGSDGTLTPCFEDGQQICAKASFKVKFDHVNPAHRFKGGLVRLNFHSMIDDPSLLRERLNAKLFADMRIVAPRVAHAFITVNGERKGLFAVVEDVDGHFTRDRWEGAGDGNLYKDAWPVSIEPEDYAVALETNKQQGDHTRMLAFAQALRAAPPAQAPAVLDRFANLDYLMRFMAVDQAIQNYDGVTAFYCNAAGGECTNHNFFWYQSQTDDRFWLIPWDLGDTLTLTTPFSSVPVWDQPPSDCNQRFMVDGGLLMAPGCDVVLRTLLSSGRPAYARALQELQDIWEVPALHRLIDGWADEIAVAVALDRNGPGLVAWRAAVRSLKRDLVALRERITALRDAETVAPFALAVPGLTDFEKLTALPVLLGLSSEFNPRSGVVYTLNYDTAIAGGADLRLDFELTNERDTIAEGAFLQFVTWRIPLAAPGKLSGLARMQLKVKADSIRHVRIEIDSPRYPDLESPRYGWDITVGKQVTDLTLDLAALKLPTGHTQGPVPLADILAEARALVVIPEPRDRNDDGLYKVGQSEVGFLQLDHVRFE